MDDLKKWDFAETFTLYQAAMLVDKNDPSTSSKSVIDVMPIFNRMERDYSRAIHEVDSAVMWALEDEEIEWPNIDGLLMCERGKSRIIAAKEGGERKVQALKDWLSIASKDDNVGNAEFSRAEICKWISANGFHSKYDFSDPVHRKEPTPQAGDVGTKELNSMLSIIIGLAAAGYGYDPAASKSDAVSRIISDMDTLGIKMSDDTLRKYLKQARQFLPSSTPKPNSV